MRFALGGPTPEDFTVFEWNANIAEIWDQALKTCESQHRMDVRLAVPHGHRGQGRSRHEVVQSRSKATAKLCSILARPAQQQDLGGPSALQGTRTEGDGRSGLSTEGQVPNYARNPKT